MGQNKTVDFNQNKELKSRMCSKWSHGSSEGLDGSQTNQDKVMRSGEGGREGEGEDSSGRQRLGLPSSVIICMPVPLFFS